MIPAIAWKTEAGKLWRVDWVAIYFSTLNNNKPLAGTGNLIFKMIILYLDLK